MRRRERQEKKPDRRRILIRFFAFYGAPCAVLPAPLLCASSRRGDAYTGYGPIFAAARNEVPMAEIIGVRFKSMSKVYFFDPAGHTLARGCLVVVETARGVECGEVVTENRVVDDSEIVKPLKKVVRPATAEDIRRSKENAEKEAKAFAICQEKIAAHKLDMKLTRVEYTFDNSKILFYFTADGRVDFRELVKDLASVFRTRIELRQIGVRDEAKMLGGLGICGRPFCCSQFLNDFQPVSIKMAKEQGLSLNPTKISGACGRLMCCLKYEQEAYQELQRTTPPQGSAA